MRKGLRSSVGRHKRSSAGCENLRRFRHRFIGYTGLQTAERAKLFRAHVLDQCAPFVGQRDQRRPLVGRIRLLMDEIRLKKRVDLELYVLTRDPLSPGDGGHRGRTHAQEQLEHGPHWRGDPCAPVETIGPLLQHLKQKAALN